MTGAMGKDGRWRHGLMLFVACALSCAAFLFAVDLSAPEGEPARAGAAAPRQQSKPVQPPTRAILADVIAAKIKAVQVAGGGALPAVVPCLALPGDAPAEARAAFRRMVAAPGACVLARGPPARA